MAQRENPKPNDGLGHQINTSLRFNVTAPTPAANGVIMIAIVRVKSPIRKALVIRSDAFIGAKVMGPTVSERQHFGGGKFLR